MRQLLKNEPSLTAFLFLSSVLATGTAAAGKPTGEDPPDPIDPAIVYADPGNGGLFVMSADGATTQRLTRAPDRYIDAQATWLPDGSSISFTRYDTNGGGTELYLINPDGSGQTRLRIFNSDNAPGPSFHQNDIVWGPYGQRVVYASHGKGSGIWMIHAFTGESDAYRRKLATIHDVGHWVAGPTFSPDMDPKNGYQGWLAWYEYEVPPAHEPEQYAEIYAVRIEIESESGELILLTTDERGFADPINVTAELQTQEPGFYGHPAWSPDGRWLAFVEDTAGFRGIDMIDWNYLTSDPIRLVETSLNSIRISWTYDQYILYDDYQPPHSRRGKTTFDIKLIDPFSDDPLPLDPANLTETDRIDEWGPTWNPAWEPDSQ